MRLRLILITACAAVWLASCSQPYAPLAKLDDPALKLVAQHDSIGLDEFLLLGEAEQAARREESEAFMEVLVRHRAKRDDWIKHYGRYYRSRRLLDIVIHDPDKRYAFVVRNIETAVAVDPSHTFGWFELARARDFFGDRTRALEAYAMVPRAAEHDPRHENPARLLRFAKLKSAWCLREVGRTDEALAVLEELRGGREFGYLEGQVLYGLALGEAGRFAEAYDQSLRIDPVKYPDLRIYMSGRQKRQSGYARRWVQAVAWLGIGEPRLARHALGELPFGGNRLPLRMEFWQDAGLVCELAGDVHDSQIAYSNGFTTNQFLMPFVNWDVFSTPPVIFDAPDVRTPCFTAYEVHRMGGSLFTLGTQLMAECAQADSASARALRGRLAVEAFDACIARGIRPVLSQALRGRTRYYMKDFGSAEADLIAACDALRARDEHDPGSLLVLGAIQVDDGRAEEAVSVLEEGVAAEPALAGLWRTLGVAYATLQRDEEAEHALDLALELEPGSSLGWHNRGLFRASRGEWEEASVDLGVAVRLAPGNMKTRELLQRSALALREQGDVEAAGRASALADSLAREIPMPSADRLERRPGVISLDTPEDRRRAAVTPVDYEAVADSLGTVVDEAPTPELRRRLADALIRCGRGEEVAGVMRMDTRPTATRDDLMILLRAERDLGESERAVELARQLHGESPYPDSELWALVALMCVDVGRRDEGLKALEYALSLDPENDGLKAYHHFLTATGGP